MRKFVALAVFLIAAAANGATTFVAPLAGSQAIGAQAIEVTTTATNVDRVELYVDGVLAGVARKPPYRIAFDFGTSLSARTVTAKVWSNGYKTSETASVITAALTSSDSINIDLVEVPMRIRSAKAVKPADLRLRENGVDQTIGEVRTQRPAAHFAFVVDRSLSMGGGKLDAALRAIQQELKQLRAGDTASLILFNHNVAKARPIARGQDLTRLFADIVPSGGTSLRDALASIATKDRTYALVITDGGDRNSVLSDEAALRKISGTKTIVNAIVMGEAHAKFLDRAASNTGGSVVAATKSSVARELQRLLADINSRYVIVYQSRGTKRGWRTIEIKPRRAGIEISSARKGYFAE